MRRVWLGTALVLVFTATILSQSAELRVASAGPNAEINQLQDANEIRIIFSEPNGTRYLENPSRVPTDARAMVDVGRKWIDVTLRESLSRVS
jgi:hypothetical protein